MRLREDVWDQVECRWVSDIPMGILKASQLGKMENLLHFTSPGSCDGPVCWEILIRFLLSRANSFESLSHCKVGSSHWCHIPLAHSDLQLSCLLHPWFPGNKSQMNLSSQIPAGVGTCSQLYLSSGFMIPHTSILNPYFAFLKAERILLHQRQILDPQRLRP